MEELEEGRDVTFTKYWKDLQDRLIEGERPRKPFFHQYPEDCVDDLAASSSSAQSASKLARFRNVIYSEVTFDEDEWDQEYIGKSKRPAVMRYLEHKGERARWAFQGPECASLHYQRTATRVTRTYIYAYLKATAAATATKSKASSSLTAAPGASSTSSTAATAATTATKSKASTSSAAAPTHAADSSSSATKKRKKDGSSATQKGEDASSSAAHVDGDSVLSRSRGISNGPDDK